MAFELSAQAHDGQRLEPGRNLTYGLLDTLGRAIDPEAAALAARFATEADVDRISEGLDRMKAAERGRDETLEADIAFHVAGLRASGNPFYSQFRDVVSTALRTSIRLINRVKGRSASIANRAAVRDAIRDRDPEAARATMRALIGGVLDLIDEAETGKKPT